MSPIFQLQGSRPHYNSPELLWHISIFLPSVSRVDLLWPFESSGKRQKKRPSPPILSPVRYRLLWMLQRIHTPEIPFQELNSNLDSTYSKKLLASSTVVFTEHYFRRQSASFDCVRIGLGSLGYITRSHRDSKFRNRKVREKEILDNDSAPALG